MSEHLRLVELGRKYLEAANFLWKVYDQERAPLDLGAKTPDRLIALAQVIAIADLNQVRGVSETAMEHDLHYGMDEFDELWESEEPLVTDLDSEHWLENPVVGDELLLHEVDWDGSPTGRSIRYRIVETHWEDLHESVREIGLAKWQHVNARFVAKMEGGETDD